MICATASNISCIKIIYDLSKRTGDKNKIYALAKQQYFAGDSVGFYQSGNEFLHTENFILVDQHRRIRGVYNGTVSLEIDRIKEDILILKSEISSVVK